MNAHPQHLRERSAPCREIETGSSYAFSLVWPTSRTSAPRASSGDAHSRHLHSQPPRNSADDERSDAAEPDAAIGQDLTTPRARGRGHKSLINTGRSGRHSEGPAPRARGRGAHYRSFGPQSTSNVGVPEVLDQLCRELLHSILIVVHPDFHQVCPVCDVPLGPKLRYVDHQHRCMRARARARVRPPQPHKADAVGVGSVQ